MSYQKEDGRGHVPPSFFWYDNDFLELDLKVCVLVTHIKCHQARLAQSVEHGTLNPGVVGSSPTLGVIIIFNPNSFCIIPVEDHWQMV